MPINTSKVPNRRQLHFNCIADILADVDRLNQSKVKPLGNWSGGQILTHLAVAMNGSIDGAPFRCSWPIRVIGRLMKRRVLTKGMTPGFQLKGQMANTLVPPPASWDEGLDTFRQAIPTPANRSEARAESVSGSHDP
jgi:hypothetical protein